MDDTFRFSRKGSLSVIVIVLFVILLLILIPLLILGLAGAAFSRLGFSWTAAVAVIVLMLAGYFVNIPVMKLKNAGIAAGETAVFDAFSGEPVDESAQSVIIALNLGGFFIPVVIVAYLLFETGSMNRSLLLLPVAICVTLVTLIVVILTRIRAPAGISVPLVLPSLSAAACGIVLNGGTGLDAAVTAFAGGISGILIGGCFVLLVKGRRAGIRRINIGGAGMLGPLFLCALLSALIA